MNIRKSSIFKISLPKLKQILINSLVDEDGNKVPKRVLAEDRKFLRSIGCRKNKIWDSNISTWCKKLENIEPYGIIDNKFLYNYHINITKRIDKNISYYQWDNYRRNGLAKDVFKILDIDNRKIHLFMLKDFLGEINYSDYDNYDVYMLEEYVKNYFSVGRFSIGEHVSITRLEKEVFDNIEGVYSFRVTSPSDLVITPTDSQVVTFNSITLNVTGGVKINA